MIVWLNRNVPLYKAVIRRPDGQEMAFLVLTDSGPVAAAKMAEDARGKALRTEMLTTPLLCDEPHKIEQIVRDPSALTKFHDLRLYRIILNHPEQEKWLLVWTSKGAKHARHFAEQTIPGSKWKQTLVVTNPIIIENADRALEAA